MKSCVLVGIFLLACSGPMVASGDESGWIAAVSIRDGVYTTAQSRRGEASYAEPCGKCHGYRLDGAPDDPDMFPTPPLAGAKFLRNWNQRSLADLYEYARTTMPINNPGYLSAQELVDIVAYMLASSGLPAAEKELDPDPAVLAGIVILAATQ